MKQHHSGRSCAILWALALAGVLCPCAHAAGPAATWSELGVALTAETVVIVLLTASMAVLWGKYKAAEQQEDESDPLTGMGNRKYFLHRFNELPDQIRSQTCIALVAFDLSRVNQYYGKSEADKLLLFVAQELSQTVTAGQFAARVSGGGFAVARPTGSEEELGAWAQSLLNQLNQYGERLGQGYHPKFHMGIYPLQPTDRDCESALFSAHLGFRQAVGDNLPYTFSRPEMLQRANEVLEMKKRTLVAVQNREFHMFLQLIVRQDGSIMGGEALSRWEHPQKGLLYPGSYIALMESEKTISALDLYIFEETCKQLELWQSQGRNLKISCNFTRTTISGDDFIPQLQKISEKYDFDHSNLIIEITEATMEKSKEAAFANISKCKDLGFQVALDDAGYGYTSFADLRDYPIDIVKIDRSVLTAAVDHRGAALLSGMIALAHSLGMEALCEGVETAEQAELLRGLGCDYLQGFYFCKVLPKEEVEKLLDLRDLSGKG